MWMLMWMVGSTQAELPLADYGRELGIARWYEVEELFRVACTRHPQTGAYLVCDDEDALRAVIRHADAFQDVVQHTAGLEYQAGLAYRLLDEPAHAKTRFRASLAIDRDVIEAWYDLGEILLADNDLDGAEEAFTEVARLQEDQLGQYTGVWRLAEVAANQRDPDAFERHMREALRRGFSFRNHAVGSLPNWKRFYADPRMRSSVEKLVSVYGDVTMLDELASPVAPAVAP